MSDNFSKKIIRETFESKFDKSKFTVFIKNLLNHIEDSEEDKFVYSGNIIPEVYRDSVSSLVRIGKYTDPDGKKIELLIVNLKKENSLDRARTLQRNFVAWYLDGSRGGVLKDAALVAFVSPDLDSWRFSLVKMDYKIHEAKVKKDLTPAKRYSFLVGSQEKSHTAQSRLVPIIEDDKNNPTLKQLEEAFNIEKVTKEFFEKYRDLFIRLKESLDEVVKNNKKIETDFQSKNIDTASFAKKLLGQIVFLYFLQKKGWFGVERDLPWGSGPKNFLRVLFDKQIVSYKNFFNDILEPLFYEALAKKRDHDYYSRLNCKIPFLNGGLFDPVGDYDWVYTDIFIDNELFSNDFRTKEGDRGNGILDVFDRYNFTVREDEPLEKEVAVDPEMLGKVFENLLEVKDRKSKGTYYTPREIVHYMCQESLINYLSSELTEQVSKEDIETLIRKGTAYIHNDQSVTLGIKKYEELIPADIKKYAPLIDMKLADIKVCDPAVGSGAFLVGMMNEIVSAREVLGYVLGDDEEKSIYEYKRWAIQNSLYGVDIDPSAVEVAKLRLWLTLVVEEDNIKDIKPLPNLDYKVMQGNSLLEDFKGVKLFDEKLLKKASTTEVDYLEELKKRKKQIESKLMPFYVKNPDWGKKKDLPRPTELSLLEAEWSKIDTTLKKNSNKKDEGLISGIKQIGLILEGGVDREDVALKLKKLYGLYFKSYDSDEKKQIRKQIENVVWELIEASIKEENKLDTLKEIEVYKNNGVRPFFLWKLYFADVFQEKGGFDVVIANPPYVTSKYGKISPELKKSYKDNFETAYDKIDMYVLFIEKAIKLSRNKGVTVLISPWNFMGNFYSFKIRNFLLENVKIKLFTKLQPNTFEGIIVDNIISIFEKNKQNSGNMILFDDLVDKTNQKYINQNDFRENENYVFSFPGNEKPNQIFKKMKIDATPLGVVALNYIGIMTGGQKGMIGLGRVFGDKSRPVLSGKDIDRWSINDKGNYVNFDRSKIHSNDNESVFLADKKILLRKTGKKLVACMDDNQYFTIQSLYNIVLKTHDILEEYILCLLNSTLFNYIYNNFLITNPEVFPYIKRKHLDMFPIKNIDKTKQKPFVLIVDKILSITSSDDYIENSEKIAKVKEYESQIDKMVYKLYKLTDEEIDVVEQSNI